jgi:large subunit ribosomal protein L22
VKKCVMSAVANAENNHSLDVNDLVVSEAYVGKNLVMKRFAARGRGRASSILKPFSQITVIVRQTEEDGEDKGRVKQAKAEKKPAKGGKEGGKPAKSAKAPAKAAKSAKPASSKAKKSSKAQKAAKETE